jgi:hypothetical protein
MSRVLHAEILGEEGPESFLVRLVRRTRHPKPGHSSNVGQFVFRIRNGLKVGDGTDARHLPISPEHLTLIFQHAAECAVLLAGQDILLTNLFHEDRVHQIGESHPEHRTVTREVIDIN